METKGGRMPPELAARMAALRVDQRRDGEMQKGKCGEGRTGGGTAG